ncbi:MAG: hypothetical protein ACR2G4_15995 [Pyrinomonadaceae bacterium]
MPFKREEQNIPTVAEAVNRHTVEELKKLCALLPTSEKPVRKGELAALILRHLEGENLRALWSRLDETQQAAVSETIHATQGRFLAERFQAKYGRAPDWGASRNPIGYIYGYKKSEPSLLCLFIYHDQLPDDLSGRLREFVPKPLQASLNFTDEAPEVFNLREEMFDYDARRREVRVKQIPVERREMERAAQSDVHTLLRLVETGKITVSDKTLRPTASATKLIASLLRGGDYYYQPGDEPTTKKKKSSEQEIGPVKAFAWPLILQAARLAELSGNHLTLTKAGRKALAEPPAGIIRAAWQRWLKTKILDELRRIEVIRGQTGAGKRTLTAVEGRRKAIAEALPHCPVGKWVKTDDFFRYMQSANFDFEVTREPWDLYIEEKEYGSLGYAGFHDWHILQGRYALCLLFEYASTLGLIDVAYISPVGARRDYTELWGVDDLDFFSRYDGLLYFRLTPLGAYALGLADEYMPAPLEAKSSLRVLPSLKVVVSGEPLSPDESLLLDAYADRASDAQWHLDQARTMEAIENGHQVAELREFLRARDEQPLPETVERFIADAESRARRLRDGGTARLIECADAPLADLIAHAPESKSLCLLRAGERHLVVPAESEAPFRKALHRLGYCILRK